MTRRKKIPDCECVACNRFNADGWRMFEGLQRIAEYLKPAHMDAARAMLILGNGCDLCGGNGARIPFVPQIIKDFLRIEYLCSACRWELKELQAKHNWPICWGATSDDEIKWFLLELALRNFNKQVYALSPAQVAKDKAFQEWLDTLPKYEDEIVEDLDIQLKPQYRRVKPRVIDIEA